MGVRFVFTSAIMAILAGGRMRREFFQPHFITPITVLQPVFFVVDEYGGGGVRCPFAKALLLPPLPPHPDRWKCTQTVPVEPQSIGDHIKRHRLRQHIMQADLARRLGVHKNSVQNWERNIWQPAAELMPAIIQFLGYTPSEHKLL